jgi:hypothetical protein
LTSHVPSFWRGLPPDFARRLIWEICRAVLIGVALSAWSLAGSEHLAKADWLRPWRVPLGVSAVCVAFFATTLLVRTLNRRHVPRYPRLDFEFHLVSKELTYTRQPDGRVQYRRRWRARALKNGLDTFTDKYHWTGTTPTAPTPAIKGQQVYVTIRKNVWQYYEVRLPHTLNKGDLIDIEVAWRLDDADRAAVPFISTTIEDPTDLLTITATFHPQDLIGAVTAETSSGIGAKRPFMSRLLPVDSEGRAAFTVAQAQLFHHYELRWTY